MMQVIERKLAAFPEEGGRDQKTGGHMENDQIVPGFDEGEVDHVRIRLQKIGDCLVLYFKGDLDLYNCKSAQNRIDKAVESGFVRLILDGRQVPYISSSGVGVLLETMKKTKIRNGDLVLLNIQPRPMEVLHLLGFSQFFTFAEDLDEAVHILNRNAVKEWPLVFKCPICSRKLKAIRAGRFRCAECKTILTINPQMQVFLG